MHRDDAVTFWANPDTLCHNGTDIVSAMNTYQKAHVAWFLSKEDPRWELSNMAGGMPVYFPTERIRANRWNSSEQLYQASKYGTNVMCVPATNPGVDPCVRNRIRSQVSIRGAKMTQKSAVKAGLVRTDWDSPEEIRLKSMLWVLELKLFWNPWTFGRVLQNTGDKPIVEISRKDDFWGCKEVEPGVLVGRNNLGLILMDIRSRMEAIKVKNFTYPEGFLLP